MNEKEIELTKEIIKTTTKDHTIIPHKLIDMVCEITCEGVGLSIELLGRAYQTVENNIEDGWKFWIETPAKKGKTTYSKKRLIKIAEVLKKNRIIKSYEIDEREYLVGFMDIENIFSEMI